MSTTMCSIPDAAGGGSSSSCSSRSSTCSSAFETAGLSTESATAPLIPASRASAWRRVNNVSMPTSLCQCLAVDLARRRVEDQPFGATVEVEQGVERAVAGVEGLIAESTEPPVVLDEAQDRRLGGGGVVDEIAPREPRHQQQRLAWSQAAAAEESACTGDSAHAGIGQGVAG